MFVLAWAQGCNRAFQFVGFRGDRTGFLLRSLRLPFTSPREDIGHNPAQYPVQFCWVFGFLGEGLS